MPPFLRIYKWLWLLGEKESYFSVVWLLALYYHPSK